MPTRHDDYHLPAYSNTTKPRRRCRCWMAALATVFAFALMFAGVVGEAHAGTPHKAAVKTADCLAAHGWQTKLRGSNVKAEAPHGGHYTASFRPWIGGTVYSVTTKAGLTRSERATARRCRA